MSYPYRRSERKLSFLFALRRIISCLECVPSDIHAHLVDLIIANLQNHVVFIPMSVTLRKFDMTLIPAELVTSVRRVIERQLHLDTTLGLFSLDRGEIDTPPFDGMSAANRFQIYGSMVDYSIAKVSNDVEGMCRSLTKFRNIVSAVAGSYITTRFIALLTGNAD